MILLSAILYGMGVAILLLQPIRNQRLKDFFIQGIVLFSIPLSVFRLIEYASISIWAFPLTLMVARFGGDEFLVMLKDIENQEDIELVCKGLMRIFDKPFHIREHEFFVTGSAGVAVFPSDGDNVDTLIKNADIAMYEAKAKGKNQFAICTEHMKDDVERDMILSNHLFRAIERNELKLVYQPQINIKSGEIDGIEALLRWEHPKYGNVSPGIFVPIAEKSGAINQIGEWVLKEACIQNKKWHDLDVYHGKIAVNVSVVQFSNIKLWKRFDAIIQSTGLPHQYVELEITESVAAKGDGVFDILEKCRALGMSIAIDDFGTEYSSLSRIKIMPIDKVKIDMQFVHGMETNDKDKAIVKVIINMAKSLNLEVIAEGVETDTQLEILRYNACDYSQGYHHYKPMRAEEVEKIFPEHKAVCADVKCYHYTS